MKVKIYARKEIGCSLHCSHSTRIFFFIKHNKDYSVDFRNFCQGASIYISTLSLTAIALERQAAVSHAVRFPPTSTRLSMAKIATINTVSVVAVLPYCIHMEVKNSVVKFRQLDYSLF